MCAANTEFDPRRQEGNWLRLEEAAKQRGIDVWDAISAGAVGMLEVCVWVGGFDSRHTGQLIEGPYVPEGFYRVKSDDLVRLITDREAFETQFVEEQADMQADVGVWNLVDRSVRVSEKVLVVREDQWERYQASRVARKGTSRAAQEATRRRDAVFGVLVNLYCERSGSRGKYLTGSPPRPNLSAVIEDITTTIQDDGGNVPSRFASRTLRNHLQEALEAAYGIGLIDSPRD